MIKKLLIGAVAIVSIAIASFSSHQVAYDWSATLADVEALTASAEACMSGGPGSSSCSHSGEVTVAGWGVKYDCSVTCRDGGYACCSLSCRCIID